MQDTHASHKFISVAGFAPASMQLDDLAPQIRIFRPFTKNVQHPGGAWLAPSAFGARAFVAIRDSSRRCHMGE